MKKGQTQGRQLQRRWKRRRVAIQAMVPVHVKRGLEAEARDRGVPVSALAAEILWRAFDTSPTTGRIVVSPAPAANPRGKRMIIQAMIDRLETLLQ